MGISATLIYSYFFKKTNHNVLYVLLIGTVLTSLFGSIQSTLTRVMDPNEYDSLLATLVASFSNVNSEIIIFSMVVLAVLIFVLRKDISSAGCTDFRQGASHQFGCGLRQKHPPPATGRDLGHRRSHRCCGTHLLYGTYRCQPLTAVTQNLPAQPTHSRFRVFGMIILVAGQLIVEHVYNYVIPISVFISVGGGIYFLYLLLTKRRV